MMDLREIPWFATADKTARWLVAVSGGADSLALLHLLVEAGFHDLVVCHLDHGLRGEDSAADAEFVRALATDLGLVCEVVQADVRSRMAARGESLETAARHERHAFFGDCVEKYDCPRVLLAHHEDDQAETVLWNLLRGSHGMKGMRERQDFTTASGAKLEFHRPLLAVRRAKLVAWLVAQKRPWREDASNAQPIAVRNRLRHEALPLLAEISSRDAVAAFARGAETDRDRDELEAWALAQAQVVDPQGRLHVPVLRKLPAALQRAAFAAFLQQADVAGVSRALLERLRALLDASSPPAVNLPGNLRIRRRAGRMILERDP
ncbi:MAG: tRNA lysidine(34) synthetase TilS [Verrucomicrobiota bacterium]